MIPIIENTKKNEVKITTLDDMGNSASPFVENLTIVESITLQHPVFPATPIPASLFDTSLLKITESSAAGTIIRHSRACYLVT
jgi:hypothetical protein